LTSWSRCRKHLMVTLKPRVSQRNGFSRRGSRFAKYIHAQHRHSRKESCRQTPVSSAMVNLLPDFASRFIRMTNAYGNVTWGTCGRVWLNRKRQERASGGEGGLADEILSIAQASGVFFAFLTATVFSLGRTRAKRSVNGELYIK
jgi:hypothetical protein